MSEIKFVDDYGYIPYYSNGKLYKVVPEIPDIYENRGIVQDARYIISDGVMYDTEDIESVNSIRIPQYRQEDSIIGVSGYLEYALRMKNCNGDTELELAIFRKTQEMMKVSDMLYSKYDFRRLPTLLRKAGRFDEADTYDEDLEETKPGAYSINNLIKRRIKEVLEYAKKINTDYVQVSYHMATCGECAKHRGRLFSISGNDPRFEKLPEDVIERGGFHEGCRCSFYAYSFKLDPTKTDYCENIIEFSQRPQTDDRTDQEKADYEEFTNRMEAEDRRYEESKLTYRIRYFNLTNYKRIQKEAPDLAPASFSGYVRMKNGNTKGYQKLKTAWISRGLDPAVLADYSDTK